MATPKNKKAVSKVTSGGGAIVTDKDLQRIVNKLTPEKFTALTEKEQSLVSKYVSKKLVDIHNEDSQKQANRLERFDEYYHHVKHFINDYYLHGYIKPILDNAVRAEILNRTREYNRVPCAAEIAGQTGLSISVVNEVLEHINDTEHDKVRQAADGLFTDKIKTYLYQLATTAETEQARISAMRLYLQANGTLQKENPTTVYNNYIQVNGVIVTQRTIAQLPPEKQELLAAILQPMAATNYIQPVFDIEAEKKKTA